MTFRLLIAVMSPYVPLLMLFAIGAGLGGVFVVVSYFIGLKRSTKEKNIPYECGLDPVGGARQRFSVKFYLVAMLFILFDIEVIFLYPWAKIFRDFKAIHLGGLLFFEMAAFLGVLVLGLAYVWKRGALEWD